MLLIKPPKTTKAKPTHFSTETKKGLVLISSTHSSVSRIRDTKKSKKKTRGVDNNLYFCIVLSEISSVVLLFLNFRSHKYVQHIAPKPSVWMLKENDR